jgi:hypothetical protein
VTSPLQAASWTQGILATSSDSPAQIEAIPLQVTATSVSPPSITIETYAAGTYTINRKDPSAKTWTQVASGVQLSANGTWNDTNITVGTMYEYQFVNTASTPCPGPEVICGARKCDFVAVREPAGGPDGHQRLA